ncbi:hypothetical protein BdWA1_002267 [Babesia duncani]|uniref:Uncharacterized protein n=1 Tax=Babesia duncani TaxID=323732 RepID=A0AAD9PIT5_9APIC|nr:hypothetical protein BdWA1_002267 [Babesia duncani]
MGKPIEQAAMFLIGFNITQMMNVYLVGSEFALKRFEISASKVSLFVGSCHSATTLSILVGIFVGFCLTFGEEAALKGWWNKAGASITVFLIALIAFLQLRYFCKSHGYQYVVRYYWLHVASGFCIGLIQMYAFKLLGEEASYYSLGNQLIGCFVSVLHYILKIILTWMEHDINFWLIAIHLFLVFLIAFVTFFVVTVAVAQQSEADSANKSPGFLAVLTFLVILGVLVYLVFSAGLVVLAGLVFVTGLAIVAVSGAESGSSGTFDIQKFKNGAMHAWAAIIMSVVGLAFLYVIYPVIGPILTVDSSRHHTILIWCLLLEATSGIIVYLIVEKFGKDIAEGGEWHSGNRQYYHLLWFLFVPYLGFGMTLLWALHHPNANFAKTMKYGAWGGIMSCLYYFSAKIISNIGYGCAYGHAKKANEDNTNDPDGTKAKAAASDIGTLNVFLANIFLVLLTFLGNAHVRNLMMYTGKATEGHVFPTDSMGGFRSCFFWFGHASFGASKNFISLFSLDIKKMLLSD